MADVDLNQLTNLTSQQKLGTQNFLTGQKGETSDYLKRYSDFIQGQEGTGAMAKRIGEELGIPTLQSSSNLLQTTLSNLPYTYSKATTGYDVNANQLARIIGQKAAELAPTAQATERALSSAQQTLGERLGYEQKDIERMGKPYEAESKILSERLAREATMFSQDNERELDALVAKVNAGVTLSEGEKDRANQLAISEKNYQNQLALNTQDINARAPVSTDTGDWMWDKQTNQWVPVYD